MKIKSTHFIFILAAGAGIISLSSCGGESPESDASIEILRTKRDSLVNLKNSVSIALSELDLQIRALDTANSNGQVLVEVVKLENQYFRHYFESQGIVETDHNATINAEVAAKITSINVKEGQNVTKGQVLILLDAKIVENGISELKTQIELAQTIYDKQKSLWDQKIGSEIQYLEAKNNLEGLKKKLETMNSQHELYVVRAPFDGVVDEIFPKEGEMASPMEALLRVINLNPVYIKADISERYLGKIQVGDTAVIEFPSLSYKKESTISRMGNFINPNNRTFKVRFELNNNEQALKQNLLAKISIMDYSNPKAIVLPVILIQQNPLGEQFVYILSRQEGNLARKRIVKSGSSYHGMVEIVDGLKIGDEVVTKGNRGIREGDVLNIAG